MNEIRPDSDGDAELAILDALLNTANLGSAVSEALDQTCKFG
jgi:hypothetical protein